MIVISGISTMVNFWSVAKVALRFGCVKQSKNLKMYLLHNSLESGINEPINYWKNLMKNGGKNYIHWDNE